MCPRDSKISSDRIWLHIQNKQWTRNVEKKTKDDQFKELQYKTEKHDYENMLKSIQIDIEYYRKKYKNLNKKKVFIIITEILVGSASTLETSTMGMINPGAGVIISSSTTNEYISKFKRRYTKLTDWINEITLLYEKTLKQSVVDKKNR